MRFSKPCSWNTSGEHSGQYPWSCLSQARAKVFMNQVISSTPRFLQTNKRTLSPFTSSLKLDHSHGMELIVPDVQAAFLHSFFVFCFVFFSGSLITMSESSYQNPSSGKNCRRSWHRYPLPLSVQKHTSQNIISPCLHFGLLMHFKPTLLKWSTF